MESMLILQQNKGGFFGPFLLYQESPGYRNKQNVYVIGEHGRIQQNSDCYAKDTNSGHRISKSNFTILQVAKTYSVAIVLVRNVVPNFSIHLYWQQKATT